MTFRLRIPACAMAMLCALGLSACQDISPDSAGQGPEASAAPAVLGVPGLDTAQQEVGYAIGLELGAPLGPIREEVDLDALRQGIIDALDGTEPKITEAQYGQVMQALAQRMQARAAAESQAFLDENAGRDGVEVTASGLQYEVLAPGEGTPPGADARVRVHYQGSLVDGSVFDSSLARGEPAEFSLQEVVPGWREGLQLMAPGARYRFWIPAELAYGEMGTPGGPIGPNAMLAFEVELLDVLPADD